MSRGEGARFAFVGLTLVTIILFTPLAVGSARVTPSASSPEVALDSSSASAAVTILESLRKNPFIKVRSQTGGELMLPLEASSVWVTDGAGNTTFLESLGQIPASGNWTAVLRGRALEDGTVGALVVRNAGFWGILNLPNGDSVVTNGLSGTRWSMQAGRPGDTALPQVYLDIPHEFQRATLSVQPALVGEATGNGSSEHSMRLSKHIWSPSPNSKPIDPTNVIFYDNPYEAVFSWGLLQQNGWIEGVCGSTKYLFIYDARHGGSDGWLAPHDQYGKPGGIDRCYFERYHARMYRSDIGDTHVPGFEYYAGVPAHWECTGHDEGCVYPQRGQDQLLADISGDSRVKRIWMWQLSDNKDCVTCPRWNGWIDMYQVNIAVAIIADPCGGTKPTLSQYSTTVSWSTYLYKSLEWQCASGGGGGGGSPYFATWNGSAFVAENNILPGGENRSTDVTDYFLPVSTPVRKGNELRVQIQEFEGEHTYLNQVRMYAVDFPGKAELAVDSYGNVLSFMEPRSPLSTIDSGGNNVSPMLSGRNDGLFVQATEGYWIDLDFGQVTESTAKLIMNADALKTSILLSLLTRNGTWILIDVKHPRVNWALEATDVSRFLSLIGDSLVIRLYWTAFHKLDWVALDTTPNVKVVITELSLDSASHSVSGDVLQRLIATDGDYADTLPGQQLTLTFRSKGAIEYKRILFVSVGHVVRGGG